MWNIFCKISGLVQSADATSSSLFWSLWEDLPFKDRQSAPKILNLEVAEPAPAPTAKAENLCISWQHIRTNPTFPRVPCQWLGVHSSSAKNPSALCFHEPLPLDQQTSLPFNLQTRLPFNSCLIHNERLLCRKGHFTATATALRQSLNILSLIIIFTRNSSFKRCIWLASEEQLHRGKSRLSGNAFKGAVTTQSKTLPSINEQRHTNSKTYFASNQPCLRCTVKTMAHLHCWTQHCGAGEC